MLIEINDCSFCALGSLRIFDSKAGITPRKDATYQCSTQSMLDEPLIAQ